MSLEIPKIVTAPICLDDLYDCIVFHKIDFSKIPVNTFFSVHRDGDEDFSNKVRPDLIAMRFYLWEVYTQELEKLKGRFHGHLGASWTRGLRDQRNFLIVECFRSIHYLLAICIRESRHVKETDTSVEVMVNSYFDKLGGYDEKLHKRVIRLSKELAPLNGTEGHKATQFVLKHFPKTYTIEEVLHYLHVVFSRGTFTVGYGGVAWDTLTSAAEEVLYGQKSLYAGLDHTFSLCHNNGAIYNKDFLYRPEFDHQYDFKFLLDCQRSGQLVNAVKAGYLGYAVEQDHKATTGGSSTKPVPLDEEFGARHSGLYDMCRAIAKMNKNHITSFSFKKLIFDGAVGTYTKEVEAEELIDQQQPWAVKELRAYFGGEIPETLTDYGSKLFVNKGGVTPNAPANYKPTSIELWLGKKGFGDNVTDETYPELGKIPVFTRD